MSWITVIWSAVAGASLVIALVQFFIWGQDRRLWANLCFALMAVGPIGLVIGELGTMQAQSPEVFGRAILWTNLSYAIGVVGSLGFVHFYFGTGRNWLLALAIGLRLLSVLVNFTSSGLNLQYTTIQSLDRIDFLGEQVSILGEWVPSPWARLGQFASFVQVVYVVDSALRLWRAGSQDSRRRATIVGGALALFTVVAVGLAGLVTAGALRMPYFVSLIFLGLVLVMGGELSRDVVRAAQLGRDLKEGEQQMQLAAEAANLGVWCRYLPSNRIWANAKWRELFGFGETDELELGQIMQRLHPEDRDRVSRSFEIAIEGAGEYSSEFRLLYPDGQVRWLASKGQVEFKARQPVLIRGASLDITARKMAEEAAHGLSGRLIHAQEAERMRLARELHDDVNQGLALLAVELDMLGRKLPASSTETSARIQELVVQVKGLSSGIHRMAQGLHPAKLQQLGLVAAVRGLCRELGAAHGVEIAFVVQAMPPSIAEDISLCLFRVTQEGLQNAIKHSGSATARVELTSDATHILLEISDQGCGFDPETVTGEGCLGLVSIRERVRLVLGRMSVSSVRGEGTRIQLQIPLRA
ncbi:MAG: hypothetical protein RL030_1538 [Pseudomonadota bacterium]